MSTSTDGIVICCETHTQRLAAYRAAVRVGFYTDECEDGTEFKWNDLNDLELALRDQPAYSFTPRELERLTAYKSAVAFGLYSD